MRYASNWLLISCSVAWAASAADWPCWRGPDGLGVSREVRHLPVKWSKDSGVAWKVDVASRGASSPVVVGDRVYVTTQTTDSALHVLAIDRANGELIWDKEIGRGKLHANNLHNMATPTPVSDGERIWALFGTGDLACLDRAGKVVWQRNLANDYGEYKIMHGMGTSPMLLDNKLYIACMHQGPSYLLALDAKTGREVWKKERNLPPKDESHDSYSSPIFLRSGDRTQIILEGAEAITGYDAASGDQMWISGGLRVPNPYGRTIAGPTAGEGIVVAVASGFQNQGYLVALKAEGRGEIAPEQRLWTQNKYSPDCPTPVIFDGKLFAIRDDGLASCLDLKTGQPHWQKRLFSSNVKVSPVVGDGKVYFMNNQGSCTVVAASPNFELLATNDLGEETLATPAISDGRLFVRTDEHVYCIAN